FFFFQAEDGIRDLIVTGVQTCALPISARSGPERGGPLYGRPEHSARGRQMAGGGFRPFGNRLADRQRSRHPRGDRPTRRRGQGEIGRASCRERGWMGGGAWCVRRERVL